MKYPFIIIDDDPESILKTLSLVAGFENLRFLASASSYDEGLNLILEHQPSIVFLEINPIQKDSNLSILLINELYRFLKVIPKIIITTASKEAAFDAFKYGIFDYLTKPLNINELRKTILALEKTDMILTPLFLGPKVTTQVLIDQKEEVVNNGPGPENTMKDTEQIPNAEDRDKAQLFENNIQEHKVVETEKKPLIICVKSYGDYRFVDAKDICYLQADNNSTDIHLFNGEMITAFKTLKHFENVLSSPFVRIHNSYIVNIDYVSRIHTGNSVCYIKNTTTKLPFSKSYKENVDAIINSITKGNYLEI